MGSGTSSLHLFGLKLLVRVDLCILTVETEPEELVSLAVQTLTVYAGLSEQQAVRYALRKAAESSETAVKQLAAAVVKAAPTGSRPTSKRDAIVLLHWSGLVLEYLNIEAAKKAVQKLVEVHCELLETLAGCGLPLAKAAERISAGLLSRKPALAAELIALASSSSAAITAATGAVRALLAYMYAPGAKLGQLSTGDVTKEALNLLCDKILVAKERPSKETLSAFRWARATTDAFIRS